mmetsp:Transcript_3123/g.4797  ORF Transcript_3123/g.4797 Transcript_3123/m.4797 type:complete len:875 (-) Transcript_3123:15-2639(-)|eukprot:CAMPEP_0171456978 /NCGR_PEP_ID=MMETSP0945-20130129/3246_1 /TAXON_ID=109269 /ORGANISM="Vaucheria litorea, Strain CCMP2940" /LENGTH=874 /DNA_ID=CAMNT_0011982505 /DNA_START=72 /DNA_END=2696 /DNA_ORIENTATION=-
MKLFALLCGAAFASSATAANGRCQAKDRDKVAFPTNPLYGNNTYIAAGFTTNCNIQKENTGINSVNRLLAVQPDFQFEAEFKLDVTSTAEGFYNVFSVGNSSDFVYRLLIDVQPGVSNALGKIRYLVQIRETNGDVSRCAVLNEAIPSSGEVSGDRTISITYLNEQFSASGVFGTTTITSNVNCFSDSPKLYVPDEAQIVQISSSSGNSAQDIVSGKLTLTISSMETKLPTVSPTLAPSYSPTWSPTSFPSDSPTSSPTKSPSVSPTYSPTHSPTLAPSDAPTLAPSVSPTIAPTWTHVSPFTDDKGFKDSSSRTVDANGVVSFPKGLGYQPDEFMCMFDIERYSMAVSNPLTRNETYIFLVGGRVVEERPITTPFVRFSRNRNTAWHVEAIVQAYTSRVEVNGATVYDGRKDITCTATAAIPYKEIVRVEVLQANSYLKMSYTYENGTSVEVCSEFLSYPVIDYNEEGYVPEMYRTAKNTGGKYAFAGLEPVCIDYATEKPTTSPTAFPSESPTKSPTDSPTNKPTVSPTESPSVSPTKSPTSFPTSAPSESPTHAPSKSPSSFPTSMPTQSPTAFPTGSPTSSPTASPTVFPTEAPTQSIDCVNARILIATDMGLAFGKKGVEKAKYVESLLKEVVENYDFSLKSYGPGVLLANFGSRPYFEIAEVGFENEDAFDKTKIDAKIATLSEDPYSQYSPDYIEILEYGYEALMEVGADDSPDFKPTLVIAAATNVKKTAEYRKAKDYKNALCAKREEIRAEAPNFNVVCVAPSNAMKSIFSCICDAYALVGKKTKYNEVASRFTDVTCATTTEQTTFLSNPCTGLNKNKCKKVKLTGYGDYTVKRDSLIFPTFSVCEYFEGECFLKAAYIDQFTE